MLQLCNLACRKIEELSRIPSFSPVVAEVCGHSCMYVDLLLSAMLQLLLLNLIIGLHTIALWTEPQNMQYQQDLSFHPEGSMIYLLCTQV